MRVRTAANNPFVPGSDQVPGIWAGRADELADWERKVRPRRLAGTYERGRALLGPPGIGKSVLVNRIAADAAAAGDLVTHPVRIPHGSDVLALVAEAVTDLADREHAGGGAARRTVEVIQRLRRVSLANSGIELAAPPDPVPAHRDLYHLLVELGHVAAARQQVVLIRIDEVQNAREVAALSQLLVALGDALAEEVTIPDAAGNPHRHVLPLVVYLTGLADFLEATQAAGATFARRFAPVVLEPLSDVEIRQALAPFRNAGFPLLAADGPTAVFMTDDAVEAIVARCLGDPYVFQLAGEAAWNAGEEAVIGAGEVERGWATAAREARSHVQRALERLPDGERNVLDAVVALPPEERTATAVARALGRSGAPAVASALQRLDDQRGILARGRPITFRMRTVERLLTGSWPLPP